MAYQKAGGTPRFYIDTPSYLNSLGIEYGGSNNLFQEGLDKDLFGLNPMKQVYIHKNYGSWSLNITLPTGLSNLFDSKKSYLGFLNHSIESDEIFQMDVSAQGTNFQNIINFQNIDNLNARPIDTGFSMYSFSVEDDTNEFLNIADITYRNNNESAARALNLGCLTFGSYYDMPVSPNLDLSMEIEFDGFSNIKTLSGSTVNQANYQSSPWWYDAGGNKVEPWSVGESTGLTKRNGRRVWNLRFSHMSDKDLFSSNYGSGTYIESYSGYEIDTLNNIVKTEKVLDLDFTSSSGWLGGGTDIDTSAGTLSMDTGSQGLYVFALGSGDASDFISGEIYTIKINVLSADDNVTLFLRLGDHFIFFNQSLSAGNVIEKSVVLDTSLVSRLSLGCNPTASGEVGSFVLSSIEIWKGYPDDFNYTIDNDDSFSSQVLNKISHGEKFIFQPDNNASNPSDFAICVLDGNSFSMERSAFNVYDIDMKIKEVW